MCGKKVVKWNMVHLMTASLSDKKSNPNCGHKSSSLYSNKCITKTIVQVVLDLRPFV